MYMLSQKLIYFLLIIYTFSLFQSSVILSHDSYLGERELDSSDGEHDLSHCDEEVLRDQPEHVHRVRLRQRVQLVHLPDRYGPHVNTVPRSTRQTFGNEIRCYHGKVARFRWSPCLRVYQKRADNIATPFLETCRDTIVVECWER